MGGLQGLISTAYGIRTRATAVKGRRPRPLDERGIIIILGARWELNPRPPGPQPGALTD